MIGVHWVLLYCRVVFKVITDCCSAHGFVDSLSFLKERCIFLKILLTSLEFLASELQAARIIKHKELHPEEETTEEESEKEQRVDDPSHELTEEYEDDDPSDKGRRQAEIQAEWILLLHALDMDTSSKFTDVLSEVSLT